MYLLSYCSPSPEPEDLTVLCKHGEFFVNIQLYVSPYRRSSCLTMVQYLLSDPAAAGMNVNIISVQTSSAAAFAKINITMKDERQERSPATLTLVMDLVFPFMLPVLPLTLSVHDLMSYVILLLCSFPAGVSIELITDLTITAVVSPLRHGISIFTSNRSLDLCVSCSQVQDIQTAISRCITRNFNAHVYMRACG